MDLDNPKDLDTLRNIYQLTTREMADYFGVSNATISRRLNKYDIETHPRIRFVTRDDRSYIDIEDEDFHRQIGIHQLSAIAGGADPYDVFGGNHVHHINGISWVDNRDNLVCISPTDHGIVEKTGFNISQDKKHITRRL